MTRQELREALAMLYREAQVDVGPEDAAIVAVAIMALDHLNGKEWSP